MGILGNIFKSKGQPDQVYQEKLFIVDANGLYEGRKGQKLTPRDQIDILQKLSHISTNESIAIHAFFEGEPLRKVEHGGKFDEITVHFFKEAKDLPDAIISHLKEWIRRKDVTVITSDRRLEERVLVDGAQTMRISTFKKAFEKTMGARRRRRTAKKGSKGSEGDSNGGSGGGGGGGGRKPRRNRGDRGKQDGQKRDNRDDSDGQDGVHALIDLVE